MRQTARRLKDGRVELVEVPGPSLKPGFVLVRPDASLISAGTERATLEVARKGLFAKARARPDQARQVLERARREGITSTAALVRQRLGELGPLGYSAAGDVVEAGSETRDLRAGDRVAIAGAGIANHAELDLVPSLLCARVPAEVSSEAASFATLGAIALNGFRQADVQVGSTVAIIGLGLVGQLMTQIAIAAGCRVLGVDLKPSLVALAAEAGAETRVRQEVEPGSRWDGAADAVLICAASDSNDPASLAPQLARDRARVVVVGDVRMDLPRGPFYDKELELRLSRSYGPGRYDPNYEIHGLDYPIGYVRWTQQRNMEAFLDLVNRGLIQPERLITHRYPFTEAERAFEALGTEPELIGLILTYGANEPSREDDDAAEATVPSHRVASRPAITRTRKSAKLRFSLIGPGAFATSTLIPGLRDVGFTPAGVVSATGLSAESARRQFGFESVLPRPEDLITQGGVDLIVIASRHDSHARLASLALEEGLAVYVEKPLALSLEELRMVAESQHRTGARLIVGFNRRHAPLARVLRDLDGPRLMSYRVNAGAIEPSHWMNDVALGGGRLKGEGCHFIDFLCDQAGSDPVTISAHGFGSRPGMPLAAADNFSLQLVFADGSAGSINYAADSPTWPGKERFETSAPGCYAVIDDFRRGSIWRGRRSRRLGGRRQDKGFEGQFRQVAGVVRGTAPPISPDGYIVSTLATLAAARALQTGRPESIPQPSAETEATARRTSDRGPESDLAPSSA